MGKSAEITDKVGIRKGLLSKKINGHTIITLEEINRMAVALEILKQVYPDPTDYPQNFQNGLVPENSSSNVYQNWVILTNVGTHIVHNRSVIWSNNKGTGYEYS